MHLHRITQCSQEKVDTRELLRQSSPSAEGAEQCQSELHCNRARPIVGSSAVRVTPIPQYSTVESVGTVRITGAGTCAGPCEFPALGQATWALITVDRDSCYQLVAVIQNSDSEFATVENRRYVTLSRHSRPKRPQYKRKTSADEAENRPS